MGSRASAAAWTALAALLGAALAWRAWETHVANAELYRRLCEAEADTVRLEAEGARLRAERDALENDPRYVERQLRERRMTQPGERLVEPDANARPGSGGRGGGTNGPR